MTKPESDYDSTLAEDITEANSVIGLTGSDEINTVVARSVFISASNMKPGVTLGDFELVAPLGRGGMGEVWKARQRSMERDVAIKILYPHLCQNADFARRFEREIKMSARLDHPNIITAHYAGEDNGVRFLALSFVDGLELADIIRKHGALPETRALTVARQIAEALNYAWEHHKMLHRDIKPANIMVTTDGKAMLMDMGISKVVTGGEGETIAGIVVGTPYYMSPEQARGQADLDFRADIYALGATLYYALTAAKPFDAPSSMAVMNKIVVEPLEPPRSLNNAISKHCSDLIEIMMAKEADQRQTSWEEVIRDIDAVLAGKPPVTPKRVKRAKRADSARVSSSWLAWGAFSGSLCAAGIIMAIIAIKQDMGPQATPRSINAGARVEPGAIKTAAELEAALKSVNPGLKGHFRIQVENGQIIKVNLSGHPELRVITPLAGLPLQGLDLGYTRVSDLTPLRGAPLTWLNLENAPVSDLTPISGAPIKRLYLNGTRVADIAPLTGMPLKSLNLSRSPVANISPIANAPLTSLDLGGCVNARNISPVRTLKTLERITLPPTPTATSVAALRLLPKLRYINDSSNNTTQDAKTFWANRATK